MTIGLVEMTFYDGKHHVVRTGTSSMADEIQTLTLHDLIARFRVGDQASLNLLIRRTQQRLEQLARRMLRQYPGVQAQEQTDDVMQNALLRLERALREVMPESMRAFYGLASEMIRRELLDLVRHHRRRPVSARPAQVDVATSTDDTEMDRWAALQTAIETLPVAQREVFSLTFYHGWTQAEIAELLQISDRQVRRHWADACLALANIVGERMPSL